ncbi:MAG: hypothetical protein Q9218_003169, partial [Villophora microphyllina]
MGYEAKFVVASPNREQRTFGLDTGLQKLLTLVGVEKNFTYMGPDQESIRGLIDMLRNGFVLEQSSGPDHDCDLLDILDKIASANEETDQNDRKGGGFRPRGSDFAPMMLTILQEVRGQS